MKVRTLHWKRAVYAVLFTLLLSVAGVTNAFSQQRIAKNDIHSAQASIKGVAVGNEKDNPAANNFAPQTAKSVVVNRYDEIEDGETMWTTYDLQSNHFCSSRMYQLPNGKVGVVGTMSHLFNQSVSDRGTGYNFYNGIEWLEQPEERIESMRTGWPTIAQWGDNGEILISHSPLRCWTREVAGQGEWVYRGELPMHPDFDTDDASWPRVATSGDHHNIIHVIADIQHYDGGTSSYVNDQVYFRSEDAENWTISYGPLADVGYVSGSFSADDYAITANGHNVAILYSGSLTNSVWMFKSTDDGLTWNARKVWEDPYEGIDLNNPDLVYSDTLYRPMNGAIVIDNNGVAHVALNTFEMAHFADTDPGSYTYWFGRAVDGILYWNDTFEGPIESEDGNPHHAARLWWPDEENPGYITMHNDPTKWIGYLPMYDDYEWNNDQFYHENDYHSKFYGVSGHPALSCDPQGNLACAFSSPCVKRTDDNGEYYYRSIYVSYRNVENGYWEQMVDELTDEEVNFMFLYSENLFTISAPNTFVPGEYWFGFQSDDQIGLYWGSEALQTNASENLIHAVKVVHNPGASDYNYISVTANPANGGTVTGSGYYQAGQTCTLTATVNEGYTFVNWTKNGNVVSTNATYSFTVTETASYVANFMQNQGSGYVITATANPPEGGRVILGTSESLLFEPFEEYTLGNKIAAESIAAGHDWWTTWSNAPGSAEDAVVANYNGTQCAHLTYGNDQVLLFGDEENGIYDLEFDILVPQGKNGYFNILHHFAGSNSTWAMQCYLHMTNDGQNSTQAPGHGTIHAGSNNTADIPCVYDAWMHFRLNVDTDTDVARYYYTAPGENEILICEWQWSLDSFGENVVGRTLSAMNFFPPENSATSEFYLDNFRFNKISEDTAPELTINPMSIQRTLGEDDIINVPITISNYGNSIGDWSGWLDFGQGGSGSQSAELYYHSGEESQGIGSDAAYTREIGIRLPATAYAGASMGMRIVSAKYYISNMYQSSDHNYIFRIYGQGQDNQPGELLAEKTVYSTAVGSWITATFDYPIYMTGQTIWATVQLEQAAGEYPLSMDGGDYGEESDGNWLSTNSNSFSHCYSSGSFGGAWLISVNCQGELVPATWASINKTEGSIFGGQSETVTLSLNSIGLNSGSSYTANLILNTNDESMPYVEIPVTLNVSNNKSANDVDSFEPLPTVSDNTMGKQGSVRISGVYEAGSICNMTAIPYEGYTFTNWTKNGVQVSTNAAYSFIVTENASYVANFRATNVNHWDVDIHQYPYNMSVTGIIQIDGVEQQTETLEIGAFCGSECRGTQRLTYFPQVDRYLVFLTLYGDAGDVMSFRLYDHALGQELDLSCSSTITFVPDGFMGTPFDPYVFDFNMTIDQISSFSQGYNWWCSYIEQSDIDGLGMLQEGLGNNGVSIRSQASGYTDYYQGYGWYGSLSSINNESSYRVITSAPCTVTMTGNAAVPSQHPITLSQGWTWIGYVPTTAMDVNVAMSGLTSTSGDKLKSQQGYADYYPGYGWFGSLNTIEPGMGLMYYSMNSNPVTFTYPDNGRGGELKKNLTVENNHWKPNTYAYPDNMTVMATIELDGEELNSDHYELAAFAANGECRGSVRLTYAEPINRHVAFLTISGKDAAELSFRLYDTESGMEYYDAEESLEFVANGIVGEASDLYVVHFRGSIGMDEFASSVKVYPNPVKRGEQFSIGLSGDVTDLVSVEIVNTLGVVETVHVTSRQTFTVPDVAGVYTLRITVEGRGTVVKKLIVK
jgi:hypothetical protein